MRVMERCCYRGRRGAKSGFAIERKRKKVDSAVDVLFVRSRRPTIVAVSCRLPGFK